MEEQVATKVVAEVMATGVVEASTGVTEVVRRGRGGGAKTRARWTRGRTRRTRGAAEMLGGMVFEMAAVVSKVGMVRVSVEMDMKEGVRKVPETFKEEIAGEVAREVPGRSVSGGAG